MYLTHWNVLIVEDELLIALDLQDAVEAAHARVVGPAATVREALDLLWHEPVNAAILDVNLPNGEITPVAEELLHRRVPFVLNTGSELPIRLRLYPDVRVFTKPTPAPVLIRELAVRLSGVPTRQIREPLAAA